MLSKNTVAHICIRHLRMPLCGTGRAAMQLMRQRFDEAIDDWYKFATVNNVGAKELIRLIKSGRAPE